MFRIRDWANGVVEFWNRRARSIRIATLAFLVVLALGILPKTGIIDKEFLTDILAILLNSPVLIAVIVIYIVYQFRPELADLIRRAREASGAGLSFAFTPPSDHSVATRTGVGAQKLYLLGSNIYFSGLTLLAIHNNREKWEFSRQRLHNALVNTRQYAHELGFEDEVIELDDVIEKVRVAETRPYPHEMVDIISTIDQMDRRLRQKIGETFDLTGPS